jgi:hypothetical protein
LDKRARGSQEEKDSPSSYLPRKRRFGSFARSLALAAGDDAKQIKAETRHGIVEAPVPLPQALTPDEDPDHANHWLTETKMRKPHRESRGTADEARSAGRRRDKDFSNSGRLLATAEGESAYLGHVRGANGGRWKVI